MATAEVRRLERAWVEPSGVLAWLGAFVYADRYSESRDHRFGRGRSTATSTALDMPSRMSVMPNAPASSKTLRAMAAPVWTEAIEMITSIGAGSRSVGDRCTRRR